MTQTTAVVNPKGGVGKTALTINLAGALAEKGRRVLLVDMDPGGWMSNKLRVTGAPDAVTLAAALTSDAKRPPLPATVRYFTAGTGYVDVVPHTAHMVQVVGDVEKMRAREHRLARVLAPMLPDYDHVVIDCPSSLDLLTDNALVAADGLLIPVQAEDDTPRVIRLLLAQVDSVDSVLRTSPLVLHGLVISQLRRPTSSLAQSIIDRLADFKDDLPVLGTVPLAVVVGLAARYGKTVVEHAPTSEHANIYRHVAGVLEGTA